jgi:osmoprotectant transport system permease protein
MYIFIFNLRELFNASRWLVPVLVLVFTGFVIYVVNTDLLAYTAIYKEYDTNKKRFISEFFNHLKITFSSVGYGILIGLPLSIAATRNKTVEKIVLPFVKIVQTIPSLSLFGFLIPPLTALSGIAFFKAIGVRGTGSTPAIIALTLYSLLPIVQNTYTALKQVDRGVVDAAKGMGMTPVQRFFKVEFLIALPVIITGIRTAIVQITGNATMAALIGAGGLGVFIFNGLGQGAMDLIVLGAIPIIILAIAIDSIMNLIYKLTRRVLLIPELK